MEGLSRVLESNTNLRIACSDLGAVTGFHPYVDVVDVFLKYLYQDLLLLLEIDQTRLGLTLLTREEEVDDIIEKLNPSQQADLQEILQQSEEKSLLQSAAQAKHFLQRLEALLLNEEVVKVVGSKEEVEMVVQEVSGRVRKRYGSHCEEEAVKRYEEVTGFDVIERNTETYYYDLMRQEEEEEEQVKKKEKKEEEGAGGSPSAQVVVDLTSEDCDVCPTTTTSSATSDTTTTTTSTSLPTPSIVTPQPLPSHDEVVEVEKTATRKIDQWVVRTEQLQVAVVVEEEVVEADETRRAGLSSSKKRPSGQLGKSEDSTKSKGGKTSRQDKSSFVLVGKIDGLSYQLDMSSEDALQWKECKVIVEMKTRVKHIHRPPPLYEQLQVVAYMKMLHCLYGDLVQYIPSTTSNTTSTTMCSATTASVSATTSSSASEGDAGVIRQEGSTTTSSSSAVMDHKTSDLFPAFSFSNNHTSTSSQQLPPQQEEKEEEEEKGSSSSSSSSIEELYIHRVCLHGPPYHHSLHWQSVVLPRLQVFRDSIVTMRRDRDLRYAFLLASQQERRALLAYLCPYFP